MHSAQPIHFRLLTVILLFTLAAKAQVTPDWTEPIAPHKVIGNVYYVGSKGLASYLITTPQGHILINSSLTNSVPLIQDSVEKLGFKFADVRILLISHAHFDHCAGSAAIIKLTGAKYMVMDGDAAVVETGGKDDFAYGEMAGTYYPPAKVDRVLQDGDEVQLGGRTLIARKTPGHTKGCTTWTFKAEEAGKTYEVVVIGSPNVNTGYKLIENRLYPQIASDYEAMFRVLKSLPCDVFLGAHGDYYGMSAKLARVKGSNVNPFIDPNGYKQFVTAKEQAFRTELKLQEKP